MSSSPASDWSQHVQPEVAEAHDQPVFANGERARRVGWVPGQPEMVAAFEVLLAARPVAFDRRGALVYLASSGGVASTLAVVSRQFEALPAWFAGAVVLASFVSGRVTAAAVWCLLRQHGGAVVSRILSGFLHEPMAKSLWLSAALVQSCAILGGKVFDIVRPAVLLGAGSYVVVAAAVVVIGLQRLLLHASWRELQSVRHPLERRLASGELTRLQARVILGALLEELLYRWLLLGAVLALAPSSTAGVTCAVVASALFFAAAHVRGGRPGGVTGAAWMAGFGLVLGGSLIGTGSFWLAVGVHAIVAGTWGALGWLRAWRDVRLAVADVALFPFRVGDTWWAVNLEGTLVLEMCGRHTHFGRIFDRSHAESPRPSVDAFGARRCTDMLAAAVGRRVPLSAGAPTGMRIWLESDGWCFVVVGSDPCAPPPPRMRHRIVRGFRHQAAELRSDPARRLGVDTEATLGTS